MMSLGRVGLERIPAGVRRSLLNIARAIIDTCAGALAWAGATCLFSPGFAGEEAILAVTSGIAGVGASLGSLGPGARRVSWRHFSFSDLPGLCVTVACCTALMAGAVAVAHFGGLRSVHPRALIVYPVLLLLSLGGVRAVGRATARVGAPGILRMDGPRRRVLLAGRLEHTVPMARLMACGAGKPVAFFDPDVVCQQVVYRIPVLNSLDAVETSGILGTVDSLCIVDLSRDRPDLTPLVRLAASRGVPVRFLDVPGDGLFQKSREVVGDGTAFSLTSHARFSVNHNSLRSAYSGRRILITGAGGSIGSEICRQLMRLEPERLILLDLSENSLCYLLDDLAGEPGASVPDATVGDVGDRRLVRTLLARTKPEIVFHVAARKHVRLMEQQPEEAVRTNFGGTINLAGACMAQGVDRFLFVSTDKAVQPASVMGATKRAAERHLLHLAGRSSRTRFVCVRLGNVMGSEGSVVQLFQRRFAQGRAIAITDPGATRYFIDIGEAADLILRAAAIGESGQLFMLEMGQPVSILRLARELAQSHGLDPAVLPVTITGLRPGERLHEKLWGRDEQATPTGEPGLLEVRHRPDPDPDCMRRAGALLAAAEAGDRQLTIALLQQAVPGYRPSAASVSTGIDSPPGEIATEVGTLGEDRGISSTPLEARAYSTAAIEAV